LSEEGFLVFPIRSESKTWRWSCVCQYPYEMRANIFVLLRRGSFWCELRLQARLFWRRPCYENFRTWLCWIM